MRLTSAQERLLLRKHLTGDFGRVKNFESIRILLEAGYLQEAGTNLVVTQKGREYCDAHHHDIPLSSYSSGQIVRELGGSYCPISLFVIADSALVPFF